MSKEKAAFPEKKNLRGAVEETIEKIVCTVQGHQLESKFYMDVLVQLCQRCGKVLVAACNSKFQVK